MLYLKCLDNIDRSLFRGTIGNVCLEVQKDVCLVWRETDFGTIRRWEDRKKGDVRKN